MLKIFSFFTGLRYYGRGILFLLTHTKLWKYILLPWFISLGMLISMLGIYLFLFARYAIPWIESLDVPEIVRKELLRSLMMLMGDAPVNKEQLERDIIVSVFFLVFLLAVLLLFYIVQSFVNKSFYEKLSCKTEEMVSGREIQRKQEPYFSKLWQNIKDKFKAIKGYLLVGCLMIFLNLIPILGQIASFFVAAYYTGISYLNFVWDRNGMSYEAKKRLIRQNMFAITGFGSLCVLFLMIPLVNIAFIPLNIVGGSLFAWECMKSKSKTTGSSKGSNLPLPKTSANAKSHKSNKKPNSLWEEY